ncbi:hypothetical protein H2199_004470 [Coniosporium tulheliwenetii]|uniref:Uncharacterized protein n=1 Tax=Coniosporium tulheliwenetii TaxID=3383036 RepID=A0ACC2Z6Y2_9PEZI|nr:hypothetical protein H2199_004470 [Cladosporium sp. JES 115]
MKFCNTLNGIAVASVTLLGVADAFWRMSCGRVQTGRIDPIVTPGRISGHAHTIVGSNNLGINSTYNQLFNAQCTSCEIKDDMSAYWSPQLYYRYPNGSFVDVPNGGTILYYLGRGVGRNNLTPYPKGFMMLAGDAGARSYDNTTMTWGNATYPNRPIADRVSFACLHEGNLPEKPYMFQTNCKNGLRAQIHFQSCWNGVDLYKVDNSHVAYMSRIDEGVCPPTHPVKFVHLFMELYYSVNDVTNKVPGGTFVFSQGDTTGYGFHADFQNGWNPEVLAEALKTCASNEGSSGRIEECQILKKSNIDNFKWQCPERPPQIGEQVVGVMDKLPGCNRVTSGPERASAADMSCPADAPKPSVTSTVDTVPIATTYPQIGEEAGNPGWEYLGCAQDNATARALYATMGSNLTTMTVESCQNFCAWKGYVLAATQFGRECYCGNYFRDNKTPNFNATGCDYRCAGDLSRTCGGSSKIEVYNNTRVTPPPPPTVQASSGKYVAKGCYKEKTGGRALGNYSFTSDTMTIESCSKFCLGKKCRWAGLEFG